MIIFFGPAGSGKSVQGQMLAARQGWRWLSAGQLLRDTKDKEVLEIQRKGELVPSETINRILETALKRAKDVDQVILDGSPRKLDQAEWLIESEGIHGRKISLVIVLEVPKSEIVKRLKLRGRVDDTTEAIEERLRLYRKKVYPILGYFSEHNINVVHIDGVGTVGQIHDRIMKELAAFGLVEEI